MKVDMAPEAITRRWRKVAELVQVCRALRIKPGSAHLANRAADAASAKGNVDPPLNLAGVPAAIPNPAPLRRSD